MSRKKKISAGALTDIVFENRNKEYGAYKLRTEYVRHIKIGLGVAFGIFALLILIPLAVEWLRPDYVYEMDEKSVSVNQMPPPPTLEPAYYSPPPPKQRAQIPPKVVKDSVPEPKTAPEEPKKTASADSTATSDKNTGGNGRDSAAADDGALTWEVDVLPQFPGGAKEMMLFIQKNIQYPEQERILNRQGKVVVSCIVNADGRLSDFKIARSVTPALDAEALRVVKMMPEWNPAFRKSKPVKVMIQIPVTFSLHR